MNMFSEELVEAMVSGGESYKPAAVGFIWERLVAARLVRRSFGSNWRAIVDHQLDLIRILGHLRDDTFRNLFSTPTELADCYASALLAVDVTKADGAEARGSGFLVVQDERPWLVICRYNVDSVDGVVDVRISEVDGAPVAIGAPILSPTMTLPFSAPPIQPGRLSGSPEMWRCSMKSSPWAIQASRGRSRWWWGIAAK